MSARFLALEVLDRADQSGRWVEDRLAAALARHPGLPRVERAFLLELVQGVKRWQIRLDYVLAGLSRLPLAKLHPLVLLILRLGAFQILFLDRVPARAAVAEAGELAKARGLPKSHVGFINALLRRVAAGDLPPWPEPEQDPVLALSVAHAHPAWLVRRWLARLSPEATQARLAANNQIPPLTIRVNTLKTDPEALRSRLSREGVETAPCRFSPVGLHLGKLEGSPLELQSYREGLWLFQDEAAQLTTFLLDPQPGQTVLELGAGRGGKTSHLGELMLNQGCLLGVDQHLRRLRDNRRLLKRWGVLNTLLLRADASRPLPLRPGSVDAVLVDAPCSGLGILKRHPEIKTRLQEADLATFPPRQVAMLAQAAPLLKAGGHLLYVTCTTEPEENEGVAETFLRTHPAFSRCQDPGLLPFLSRALADRRGFFSTLSINSQADGFFGALFLKK